MAEPTRVYLFAEFQNSAPFGPEVWAEANRLMQAVPGLRSKTWLSGVGTHSVGGFYEFDSIANAHAYADGLLAEFARSAGASLSVKLFDGDAVAEASRAMNSPFYAG